jgi:hypothetical protein
MSDLVVAPCSYEAAKFAVMNWHYSETMPVGKAYKVGAWEDSAFIGAVLFGWGANHNLSKPYGLDMTECVELVRVAMREHASPVSQVVAQAMKHLKRDNPRLRLVVSFADPYRDHHGGIYQAGNWIYAGQSPSKIEYQLDDKILNRRAFTGQQFGKGATSRASIPTSARPIEMPGKHRYLYPLDKAMRRKITPLALPYPRGSSLNGEMPTSPVGGSGSIPESRSTAKQ